MAMARSSVSAVLLAAVAPLLLLSALVSTASAARAVGGAVQDACSKTQFPKICTDSLAAKPESQKATPRKLAELFVTIAAEKGAGMATLVQGKKDQALSKCYDSCSDDVEEAVAHLNGLVREPTDAKFLELKSWLSSTLGGTSACEDACKDAPKGKDKDDVVNFSLDFEKLQRVTLDLINEASGSMSAGIALPPSDAAGAPSYGAAAPSYGGGSVDAPSGGDSSGSGSGSSGDSSGSSSDSSGSEGPAASAASGPSSGGDTPAYGASASGPAAADAPASSPSSSTSSSGPSGAPAPKSSDSSGAPGPSSDAGSSSAPAPSSGDGDDYSAGAPAPA